MHTLYYSPGSCSLAPHIVLEEIGEPYRTELVDATGSRKTDTDAWRAINPKARVPVLSDVPGNIGGAADMLTETHAILLYLARSYPSVGLLPEDVVGQARVSEWINWLSSAVHAIAYGQIWRPHRFVGAPEHYDAVREQGVVNLAQHNDYIERLLSDGRSWSVGHQYSVVDPYLLVFWRWGERVGIDMPGRYPSWLRLSRRTVDRPAVQRVLERLSLEVALGTP